MTCGVFGAESVNGTHTCVCVSDGSFFYGMVGAGAVFYLTGRTLFNTPEATNLVFLVAAIFAVIAQPHVLNTFASFLEKFHLKVLLKNYSLPNP